MKKQMIWGLAILMLLIGIAGVFLLIPQDTDTESKLVLGEATKKLLEDGPKQQVSAQEAGKPPPPGASPNGHWHDGVWHEEPHAAPADTTTAPQTLSKLSEAEIKARVKALREQQLAEYRDKWGEDPSPDGSYQHFRDNHGNVHRHYRNTVVVSHYDLKTGFAPMPVQLQQYKQLRAALKDKLSDLKNGELYSGDTLAEIQRIRSEIQTLVDSSQGEVPDPTGFGYYGDPIPIENQIKLDNKAVLELYQRLGVEHLYELYKEKHSY